MSIMMTLAAFSQPALPNYVAEALHEVRENSVIGERYWPGFATASFSFLYVSEDGELLLCDERVPQGFSSAGNDETLSCSVSSGPPSWRQPSFLASMPIFGLPETIVMGRPEASGLSLAAWKRTVMHEHFHQWQGQLPDIYARIDALNLSGDDQSGMWMINYAFPYDDPTVGAAYERARAALLDALAADDSDLREAASHYLAMRREFAATVSEKDWRYYDFQLWKEGVARWTDTVIAKAIGGNWAEEANISESENRTQLLTSSLADMGRISVYAYGAAEASLLDRLDPDWRGCYRVVLTLTPCWESISLAE